MRILSKGFFWAVGMGLLTAGTSLADSLEEELATLLIDHPQIKAGQKTVEARRQEISKSWAGYFPTLSSNGTIGPQYVDSPGERTRLQDQDHKVWSRTGITAGVTATQNLFNGYNTASLVKTARLTKEIAELTLKGTRQNILFEGTSAYIDVLRQMRLIDLARNNEMTIQRQLNLEDERVRRGSGIAVDVLQAKSRLQLAKERRVNFEGALEDSVSRYFQVYGHAPNLETITDPVPPVEMIPSELERAIDIALVENPALDNSNATVEVARERRTLVKSEYFPSFDLVGSWNFEKNNNAVVGVRRDYSVAVQSSWDLFTGFSTSAGMMQAGYDYRASKDNHDFVARKVVEQTKLAWQALLTTRLRLELLENAVNIAGEVFDSRKKLREAGKETVINVLDAENEVINAQINFTSASYDERLAVFQLLQAMGRLNTVHLGLPEY